MQHVLDRMVELQKEGLSMAYICAVLAIEGHSPKDIDAAFNQIGGNG